MKTLFGEEPPMPSRHRRPKADWSRVPHDILDRLRRHADGLSVKAICADTGYPDHAVRRALSKLRESRAVTDDWDPTKRCYIWMIR